MCKDSRPEAAKARNGQICEYAELLIDGDERLLEKMTSNLKNRLKELNINHGYITGPPQVLSISETPGFQLIFQINNTMAAFRRKIPSLRTVDDLRHWIRTKLPEKRYLLDTNYLLSHLEQEIMYLSTKFIGSPLSSWTQTVFFDRMAVDIDGQFIKRYK